MTGVGASLLQNWFMGVLWTKPNSALFELMIAGACFELSTVCLLSFKRGFEPFYFHEWLIVLTGQT